MGQLAQHSPPPVLMPDIITSLPGPDEVISFEGLKLPCFNAVELVQGAVISAPLKSNSHDHGVGCDATSDPGGSVQMLPHRVKHSNSHFWSNSRSGLKHAVCPE